MTSAARTTLRLLDQIAAAGGFPAREEAPRPGPRADDPDAITAKAMLESLIASDYDLNAAIVRLHGDA